MISLTLRTLDAPQTTAANLRFRIDTGANLSAIPFDLAADVLNRWPAATVPTTQDVRRELEHEMLRQKLRPTTLGSISGVQHRAFPLWVPVELIDDRGDVGELEMLIAFVEGQHSGAILAGLSGFLDRFDLSLFAREFTLIARPNSGVRCPG
jgi:hypothetical protein